MDEFNMRAKRIFFDYFCVFKLLRIRIATTQLQKLVKKKKREKLFYDVWIKSL